MICWIMKQITSGMTYAIFRLNRQHWATLLTSVAILAETSLSSPRNYLMCIIKNCICRIKVPQKEINIILIKRTLLLTAAGLPHCDAAGLLGVVGALSGQCAAAVSIPGTLTVRDESGASRRCLDEEHQQHRCSECRGVCQSVKLF